MGNLKADPAVGSFFWSFSIRRELKSLIPYLACEVGGLVHTIFTSKTEDQLRFPHSDLKKAFQSLEYQMWWEGGFLHPCIFTKVPFPKKITKEFFWIYGNFDWLAYSVWKRRISIQCSGNILVRFSDSLAFERASGLGNLTRYTQGLIAWDFLSGWCLYLRSVWDSQWHEAEYWLIYTHHHLLCRNPEAFLFLNSYYCRLLLSFSHDIFLCHTKI